MNDFNSNNPSSQPRLNAALLVVGIGVVVLGFLGALEELTYFRLDGIRVMRFWPIIIVALGVVKLFESGFRSTGGWIITLVGGLLLARSVSPSGLSIGTLILPSIFMAIGVFIVLNALKRHRKVPPELRKSGDFARGVAIFSAYNYKPNGGQFNGGEATAIFGALALDLRHTTMKHDITRIDVFILFGGGEIRVPEGWDVSVQVSAILGGVDDKTADSPVTDSKRPKLLITGTVLFGGVEVK